MADIEQLKQEATELGIKFNPKIGVDTLQAKIDKHYESQETVSKEIEEAVAKTEEAENEVEAAVAREVPKHIRVGKLAREAEAKARKTRVISIVDNDQRQNNHTTCCTVNCGNAYFELGQIILPLNTPVEVMQGYINVLEEVEIPLHMKDPKTGLSTVELRNRYSISYKDVGTSK